MSSSYQRCTRCVLDTSDRSIRFDENGVCNHCHYFDAHYASIVFDDTHERNRSFNEIIARIKKDGKGKEYDCLIGMSGGVDSSYVAYLAVQQGLRPLALHVDAGWNSELAVSNIHNIVSKLKVDLKTFVVDWEEMRDLQLSFFKASVTNCDIPQDHAFVAAVYRTATEEGIRTILSGVNLATEATTGVDWGGYSFFDLKHIKAIQRKYGSMRLRQYPTFTQFAWHIYYPYIKKIRSVPILNYVHYNKQEAKSVLMQELGWRDYGGKHHESILTAFLQEYYFIQKCGFDKRLVHLTDLIHSNQMTREAALKELESSTWSPREIERSIEYVAKKLGLSTDAFRQLVAQPLVPHSAYAMGVSFDRIKSIVKRLLGRKS
jgi:N-acetyl sugar amidotransferase